MTERFRCAVGSTSLGEPCLGTASQIRRWVLVEQPGTWGSDAVLESGLPADVGLRLRAVARAAGARVLLIRRHGRSAPARRACFVAVTTDEVRRIERVVFSDPAELLELPWEALREFEAVGGEPIGHPLYLVCTNGRHDPCCAEFGRPVARELDAALGAQVWESSHFGGDRFAGNLVCLPDGIYYGRVTPDDALRLVTQHAAGELDLGRYRGRSWQPFAAQAAESLVRAELGGLRAIDGLIPTGVDEQAPNRFVVSLVTADRRTLVATVECEAGDSQQLTCHSAGQEQPRRYRLVGVSEPT